MEYLMRLTYRPLRYLEDWAWCRRLASDPVVRAASLDPRPPTLWGHAMWMWVWTRPDPLLIARAILLKYQQPGDVPLGLVRAHAFNGGAEVSIALRARARGYGWGAKALTELTPQLAVRFGGPVYARIKAENAASAGAFAAAGYAAADVREWDRLAEGRPDILVLKWEG